MARLIGDIKFEGSVDGLCFYKMEGEFYVRRQSSLTGKKFWKAACFEGSRRSCQRLSRGSQLAAIVYNNFRKQKGMYAALKTKAITLLKNNSSEEKVTRKLVKLAFQLQPRRRHSSSYIHIAPIQKEKVNKIVSLFSISYSNVIQLDNYNRYLSSA